MSNLEKEEKYSLLYKQVQNLISKSNPIITNLSNIVAAIYHSFDTFSWVGFYLLKNDSLFLGPFQGKVACTIIKLGNGVCGTSAKTKKSIIVPDVNKFPGHIACDVESKSEVVIPLITKGNDLSGVLDIDSKAYSTFDNIDKAWLEKLCKLITEEIQSIDKILD